MATFASHVSRRGMDGTIGFPGVGEQPIGPPADFGGRADVLNPETLFVGAVNACLMMTFHFFADRRKIGIVEYESSAEGAVEKSESGSMWFSGVRVRARAKVSDPGQIEACRALAPTVEKYCLVSASLKTPVHYEIEVEA